MVYAFGGLDNNGNYDLLNTVEYMKNGDWFTSSATLCYADMGFGYVVV